MGTNQKICQHVKADGTACKAVTLHNSNFCFFHDPDMASARTEARKAGGRANRTAVLPPDSPGCSVKTAAEVIDLMSQTINQVRVGALDPRVGNCVGYLVGITLKAIEQGEQEERLAILEAIVSRQECRRNVLDAEFSPLLDPPAEDPSKEILA